MDANKGSAKTKIDEGWGYKWFNSNRLRYQIDYHVKLPKSSARVFGGNIMSSFDHALVAIIPEK